MDERRYIGALIERKGQLALSALETPTGGDAYHFGFAVGLIKGMNTALELLKEQLRDEKEKDL